MKKKTYDLEYITQNLGYSKIEIIKFVEKEIIVLEDNNDYIFDDEDLGRLSLISQLKEYCDANDESIQVMLHLIDQIHFLNNELKNINSSTPED